MDSVEERLNDLPHCLHCKKRIRIGTCYIHTHIDVCTERVKIIENNDMFEQPENAAKSTNFCDK